MYDAREATYLSVCVLDSLMEEVTAWF